MWNCLVTPTIDDREGMEGGCEGTSAKKANLGRELFSVKYMKENVGVAVGFQLCFMESSVKN